MEASSHGSRWLLGAAFLILLAVLSAAVLTTPSRTVPPAPVSNDTAASSSYTLATVAGHNSANSCWTAINGKVYDVTSWVSQHPGGAGAILSLCGTDGSAAFNAQHGGQRRPASELASFLIGNLSS